MKKLRLSTLIVLALFLIITSCAKVFYSPDCVSLASNHKIIAIIPPTISISARKKVDAAALKEQQRTESVNFQKEIYGWMLKRKMQGRVYVELLDIETTTAKLKKAGYPDSAFTPGELAEILGVDGIITSNFALSKPMSEGGAVALGLIFGVYGPTNEVAASMSIHDAKNKKLIWNYDHKFSGSVGSNPSRLVDALMRNASKKMPYTK